MHRSSSRALVFGLVCGLVFGPALALSGCGGAAQGPEPPRASYDLSSADGALAALDDAERALDGIVPRRGQGGLGAAPQATGAPYSPPPPPVKPTDMPGQAPPQSPPQAPQAPQTQSQYAQPSAPTSAPPTAGRAQAGKREEEVRQPVSSDPCSTACSALASMERAASRLCTLTGDGDTRCQSARSRVQSASDRVRASCPSCAGA